MKTNTKKKEPHSSNRGFLIAEVDGVVYATSAPIGEPKAIQVEHLARKHGFEIKLDGYVRSFEERRQWPLRLRSYTSHNRDGYGRSGSSIQSYPARVIPCPKCKGHGTRGYQGSISFGFHGGVITCPGPTCDRCEGSGRA